MTTTYSEFLSKKHQVDQHGFEPVWMPDFLDFGDGDGFQHFLADWAIRKGRGAVLAGCGLGKTPIALVFAQNVIERTNKPFILATPIAVGQQIIKEAEKFGVAAKRTRDGKMDSDKCVWVTNYEQLHKYDPSKFGGCGFDESSAIKDFKSERKSTVTEFARTIPYRLLCTATAAPNDYWELGTSSEALGGLGFRDMITTFFKQETQKDRLGWGRTKYRFRGHAQDPFWAWVCSWARSLRKPSDLGFDDSRFILPPLVEDTIVVEATAARPGMLFAMPAGDMREERAERRHTLKERCEKAVEIAKARPGPCVLWCELNQEGDLLEKMLDNCVQVHGAMTDDAKEEALSAFSMGQIQRLVIKPKIGAWGLNWQHCSNTVVMPSHSFEQYYQLVHRFYRFGQKNKVTVTRIICAGEQGIINSLERKKLQAESMFTNIVSHMKDAMHLASKDYFPEMENVPPWLSNGTSSAPVVRRRLASIA